MNIRFSRQSLRFILPLLVVLGIFALAAWPLVDSLTQRWFVRDVEARSQLLANTLEKPLAEFIPLNERARIGQLLDSAIRDERLFGIAICDPSNKIRYKTSFYLDSLGCQPLKKHSESRVTASLLDLPQGPVHITEHLIESNEDGTLIGKLILVQDMSFMQNRSASTKMWIIATFILLGAIISAITVVIAHLTWRSWNKSMKQMIRGELRENPDEPPPPEFEHILGEIRALMRDVSMEQREIEGLPQIWNPDRLRSLLRDELSGDEILVVSNREPYIHNQAGDKINVLRPASGLVTAVEPVMRACSGTWIAHGAGSADRQTVDTEDHVRVPPENPSYTLRRVWLTEEEEQGYYYGFANEGLWPLCHIAHVRPIFRASDWEQYVEVNQRFANAVIKEARTDNPVILVQDYHFALLPRMVSEVLPKATIITFWHIPWPNPESFGICPWREEILEGLLGSTILGFHTPYHCKNFIETVDRYLETRIEHEDSTISYNSKLTQIRPYPISIAWPDPAEEAAEPSIPEARHSVREQFGIADNILLGVGVDRLDYTKGIIERFEAIERMLELHPDMIGRFTLLQIAAPSRSSLDEYQFFENRVLELANRINEKYGNNSYTPIILRIEHHTNDDVRRIYRAADTCLVTSLHDGMNLVAKEFIAERSDDHGVLILSQFTGAARELHEALIVNPYNIEMSAQALYRALIMPEAEQRDRMKAMRTQIKEYNVYRWAGRMLADAARLRNRERVQQRIYSYSRKYRHRGYPL
ncbi:MAG: trehalose-6-phosphate synthase [Oxalobacter sp.]|nr:trehalose-6-phosphate synthase [Oxalobacter sp.]